MPTENKLVIQTNGLTKIYKGSNALQSLDLQVPHNSICGFLGPNGAGKRGVSRSLCKRQSN
jgi:ABC-2 type transport system ATP-binding protein